MNESDAEKTLEKLRNIKISGHDDSNKVFKNENEKELANNRGINLLSITHKSI